MRTPMNRCVFAFLPRSPLLNILAILLIVLLSSASTSGQSIVGTVTRPGLDPWSVAVYETGNKLLIHDGSAQKVLVYDGTTLEFVTEIPVGPRCQNVAWYTQRDWNEPLVVESRAMAYLCTQSGSNRYLTPIDLTTFTAEAPIYLQNLTSLIASVADAALGQVYVAFGGEVDVVNMSSRAVTRINLLSGGIAGGIAINPITHEVFISDRNYAFLNIIDGNSLSISTVPVPYGGYGVTVNTAENKVAGIYASWGGYWVLDRDTGNVTPHDQNSDATYLFYSPTENRMYSNIEQNARVLVVDGITDNWEYLPFAAGTYSVAIRNATRHVYFASDTVLGVLDGRSFVEEYIALGTLSNPNQSELAINQTTGRVYMTVNSGVAVVQDEERMTRPPVLVGVQSWIYRFDPVSRTKISDGSITAVGRTRSLAFEPGGRRYYIGSDSTLFEFDGSGGTSYVTSTNYGAGGKNQLALTPDGTHLYVAGEEAGVVRIHNAPDIWNHTDVATSTPTGIAAAPSGAYIAVAKWNAGTVDILSTSSNTVTNTWSVGNHPMGIAFNPAGTRAYVVNSGSGTVSVIDTNSGSPVATVTVGATPHWIEVSPDGKRAYVTNYGDGTLSVIDINSNAVVQTVNVGDTPEGVAVSYDASEVYVANWTASTPSSLTFVNANDFSIVSVPLPAPPLGDAAYGAIPVAAADPTSRVAGHVSSGGGVVGGALVRAFQSGVEKAAATTNAAGDYSIHNLVPGTYDIEIDLAGYEPQTAVGVVTTPGRISLTNFALVQLAPTHITVTAPNGGESWQTGTTQTIQWTADVNSGNVSIALMKSGVGYKSIATGVPINTGVYNWTLPMNLPVAATIPSG